MALAKDQNINSYTDSKYVYNISHSNIIIWRERGFLTQKGTPIVNASFISELLHMAQLPNKLMQYLAGDTSDMALSSFITV